MGYMNSGVAREIRKKYPQTYSTYKSIQQKYGLKVGTAIPVVINSKLVVWNLLTQKNISYSGKQVVSYEAIKSSIEMMKKFIDRNNRFFYTVPQIVHTPMLGAGLGGGDWTVIEPIITESFSEFEEVKLWVLK